MKSLIIALILVACAVTSPQRVAADGCTTSSYSYNGRVVTCYTCCYYGNCTTNCV